LNNPPDRIGSLEKRFLIISICRVAVLFDKLDKTARKGILSKSMNRQSGAPLLESSHEIQTRRSKPDPHEGAFF
jgi:hypothetical protein